MFFKKDIITFYPTVPGVDVLTPIEQIKNFFPYTGFLINLWTDLFIRYYNNFIDFKSSSNVFEFSLIKEKNLCFIETKTPWKIKTKTKMDIFLLPPFHKENEYIQTTPKLTDSFSDLNITFKLKKYGDFLIKKGTPLAIALPYKAKYNLSIDKCIPEKNLESYLI